LGPNSWARRSTGGHEPPLRPLLREPHGQRLGAALDSGDGPGRDRGSPRPPGDLPWLTEGDVDIEIKDNVLTVSGERKAEHEDKGEGYHRVERAFGSFSRSLSLPAGIEAEQVEANFENGVLEVRIPKPAEAKPMRVQIGKGSVEGTGTEK
jgi:hypothetical protein